MLWFAEAVASPDDREEGPEAGTELKGRWTVLRLDLTVVPDLALGRLVVEGTIRLRLDSAASAGLDLAVNTRKPHLLFRSANAAGAEVALNDTLPGNAAARVARLRFPEPRKQGSEVDVSFVCEGDASGFQIVATPELALASWVEGWYPSPLGPEGAVEPASAPGTLQIVLPPSWRSVSNGRAVAGTASNDHDPDPSTAPNTHVEIWEVDVPVARSFVAAPYQTATVQTGDLEVGVHLLSAKPTSVAEQAETLGRALAALEERFGPYPYPSYAIAELPEDSVEWSASSEQGFIMAKSSIFAVPGGNLPLFAHEAAHGWWGNLVRTKEPGAKFCAESMAEYSAVLAIEALEGSEAATHFLEYSREGYNPLQSALGYFYMWRDGGDKPLAELADDKWDHNLADSKGAWVLHMLRREMGDEAFFTALRRLLGQFAGEAISLHEVEAACAGAAPDSVDVAGFFEQWFRRAGAPVLDLDWWSIDRGRAAEVRIVQLQEDPPFRLPIEIAVDDLEGGTSLHRVVLEGRETTVILETAARPTRVTLDPGRQLLIWRPQYGPRPPGSGGPTN